MTQELCTFIDRRGRFLCEIQVEAGRPVWSLTDRPDLQELSLGAMDTVECRVRNFKRIELASASRRVFAIYVEV